MFIFNFSQYHKITGSHFLWGWKGPLEVIWSKPLLNQYHLEQASQDHIYTTFKSQNHWVGIKISMEGIATTSVGNLCIILVKKNLSQWKGVSWCPDVPMFQSVSLPLLSGHRWTQPGFVFFTPSFRYLHTQMSYPLSLPISRLNSPNPLDLSSQQRCPSLLLILVALWWTLPISLVLNTLNWDLFRDNTIYYIPNII